MSKKNNSLKKASIQQLENELSERKSARIAELKQEVNKCEEEINILERKIISNSLAKDVKKITKVKKSMARLRASNETSLKELLISIGQDGKTRTTNEFMTAAQEKGWKTSSPKPYYVVAAALAAQEKKNIFRRVAKGSYELVKTEQV